MIYFKTFVATHSRLLSPLFACFAFYTLIFGDGKGIFKWGRGFRENLSEFQRSLFLLGGVGVITAIVGFSYVLVHAYYYMVWLPLFAFLGTDFILKNEPNAFSNLRAKVFIVTGLIFGIFYPYGIYKTDAVHDFINSLVLAGGLLVFLFATQKRQRFIWALLALTALGNFSQVVNYRNEPDTAYEACRGAMTRYLKTGSGKPKPAFSYATQLYCRGIPFD